MKTNTMVFYGMLTALRLSQLQPCRASLFEMTLERNSIYAPGSMNVVMALTKEAFVQGKYTFGISIFKGETTIRKQLLPAAKDGPVIFELDFPQVRERTDVRFRAELYIDGWFIEGRDKVLTLWPPLVRAPKQPEDKVIWVFDTSGALQRIFKDLEVEAADATFQAIRDFQTPDMIFIGEEVGLKDLKVLADRILSKNEGVEAVVFLRQKVFPEDWPVQIAAAERVPERVFCDPNSAVLLGLSKIDIMDMARSTIPARIAKSKDNGRKVDSYVGKSGQDKKHEFSYLAVIKEEKLMTVYCQLPVAVVFSEDPLAGRLFANLLQFVYDNISRHDN